MPLHGSLNQVQAKGVEVLAKEQREMTKEEAAEFYKQHEGSVRLKTVVELAQSVYEGLIMWQ